MKRLTILYGDFTVFDADVAECEIKDTASGITVVGKTAAAARTARPSSGSLAGLFSGISEAAKRQQAETLKADQPEVVEAEDATC